MDHSSERRCYGRFKLNLPAVISSANGANDPSHQLLMTRDISDRGAYFSTTRPLSCDGPVNLEFLLEIPSRDNEVKYVHMTTSGVVIRRDASGLAVWFDQTPNLKTFQSEDSS